MENQKKILVVEDEQILRQALIGKLTHEGFSVQMASDGEEGLRSALSEHPDLILLDIVMPTMDGVTMLKKLREDDWGQKANVIILTNLSDAEKMEESLKAGVHDYLIKADWKLEDLVEKIKIKLQNP
ncbi:response regulator [Candidatus Daviesbacteria bacterium]|nr:response regulator [Candidatus Daviesbacteria bacterium]